MRLIITFIALCVIRKSIQKVEFYEEKVTPKDQILCVKTALEKYSVYHSDILFYSTNSSSIVNSLFKVPLFLATEWDSTRKILSGNGGALVIFLEGNADQDFNGLESLQGFVILQPVLVVCIADAICASDTYMKKIIEMVASAEMHYVAMNERGIIDIYEHTTTAQGSCGMAQLSRRGHCLDEVKAMKVVQTTMNFHECPMRVISWTCPPYSEPCDSDDSDQLCGIEGNIVKDIAKMVNATPTLIRVETPLDVRQLVAKRYADLGFGKLLTRPYEGISYSMPYLFVKATIIAPHSTWAPDGLSKNIFLPLKLQVWIGIVAVIASILILRTLVPYFRKINLLQLFGMLIGIPIPTPPRGLPNQIYFLSLILFGYICSQAYLSDLTKVFLSPQKQTIKTLDDLENSNIPVMGTPIARKKFIDDYPRIYRDFKVQDYAEYNEKFLELLTDRPSSALYVEVFKKNLDQWKALKSLEDGLGWFPVAIATPNSSALKKATDKILASMAENGIVHEYVIVPSTTKRYSKYMDFTSSGKSSVLKFDELQGVFLLLVGGLSLSFFVFIIEILTAFIKTKGCF